MQGLQTLDWIIIAIYATSTIGLGWYFSRKQRSTNEYFVGSGKMNPILIGISLFATLLSTISYLSGPGEAAGKGPGALTGMAMLPFAYVIIAYWILPVYMRHRAISAYELLEAKLGLGIRLLGATLFLVLRLVWMSALVYLAAGALVEMMGVHPRWIPLVVLATGLVSVVYTTLGGLRAVVITDLMQSILLFGGALLVLITITVEFGGFGWFPTSWQPSWDTQPFFSFDPKTRISVVGTFISGLLWTVCTAGGDQVSVQRFMATRDAGAARRALLVQTIVTGVVMVTLHMVGFALLAYFARTEPGIDLNETADQFFPRYIAYHLPVGVSGLVVAALFAAAMSSIDSGVNSITAVVMTDFLDRFDLQPKTKKGHVRAARLLAFTVGATVVVGSSFMDSIRGNYSAVTNKSVNLLTTPIFCLFIFALFVPFARPLGVLIGTIFGTTAALLVSFSGPFVAFLWRNFDVDPAFFRVKLITEVDPQTGIEWITAEDPISFQWIAPVAFTVNIVVGCAASWLLSRGQGRGADPQTKAE